MFDREYTLELLNESIGAWEAIVDMEDEELEDYRHECPLCAVYEDCIGCCIAEDTGDVGCDRTVYYETRAHSEHGFKEYDVRMLRYLQDLRARLEYVSD